MQEKTGLPFTSCTKSAHLCGHDGHTACLMAGAARILDNIESIPENKTIRLFW